MFATWPIIGKIALRTLPSTALVAVRVCGAAIVLQGLRVAWGGRRVERGDYARLALYSMLGVVLNQLLYVKGLEYTTAINAALFAVTIPVFALLISVARGTDVLTWRKTAGVMLAACGVLYLIDPWHGDLAGGTTLGNVLMVTNSVAYAAYVAISKDMFERYGATVALAWIFLFGALVTLPVGAYQLAQVAFGAFTWRIWAALVYIILAPTVGAYFLNGWALARVAPSTVAVYIYLQPLIAFVVAPLVLGETWNSRTIVATLLIFGGLALVTRRNKSKV